MFFHFVKKKKVGEKTGLWRNPTVCVARLPAFSEHFFFFKVKVPDIRLHPHLHPLQKSIKQSTMCLWSPRRPPLSLQSLVRQGSLTPTLSSQSAPSSVDDFVHSGLLVTRACHNELVIRGDVTAEHRRRLL